MTHIVFFESAYDFTIHVEYFRGIRSLLWKFRRVRNTHSTVQHFRGRDFCPLMPSLRPTQSLSHLCTHQKQPPTNFRSTLRTMRILKVSDPYLKISQGQKLTLRMQSDLKKISKFLFVTFRNKKFV